ncbi:MAG: RNA polymerase factor sigma-32 [Pseudomonadota bacterium]|jgi:RNA polymerase sigma-32 factor
MTDTFTQYLNTIGKFSSLTAEQEQVLAKRVQAGDALAFRKLMESYLRLVVKVAGSYKGYGLPIDELVQEGNIGLMQAIRRFEPERGLRLSTYAMFWIRASMQEYILNNWSMVKIGTSSIQKKLFFNLRRLKAEVLGEHIQHLNPEAVAKIAAALEVTEADVVRMDQRLRHGDESLNAPMGNDGDSVHEWQDFIPDTRPNPETLSMAKDTAKHRRASLTRAMAVLNDRERQIFVARHLCEAEDVATLETLSVGFGVSRERVRQLEARAYEKVAAELRKTMN